MPRAEILIVGDEILMGEIEDENGPWLLNKLSQRGILVERLTILPDHPERIAAEIQRTTRESVDYLLMTGGIGPTHDDRTREAVALGLDRECTPHEEVIEWLRRYYQDRVNDARLRMANLPEGSDPILLKKTPALAFRCQHVFVFPGIPELMKPLFQQWEDQFEVDTRYSESIDIRAWEGDIAEPLEEVESRFRTGSIGSYPHPDGTLTLRIRGQDSKDVQETTQKLREKFEDLLVDD